MPPIFSHFCQIVEASPNPSVVVVEIGACDGFHSQIMVSLLRNNNRKPFSMHSFEPNPTLHASWKQWTLNHSDKIVFQPKAVGSVTGKIPFYFSSEKDYYGSSSLRKPTPMLLNDFKGMKFDQGTVDCIRLDDYTASAGLPYIDFIWMDVQGAERDVFEGAKHILESTRYIYTEYVNAEHYEGEFTLPQLMDQLGSDWVLVEDYGGDALLRNARLT